MAIQNKSNSGFYSKLYRTGVVLEHYSKPIHTINTYKAYDVFYTLVANVVKFSMWSAAIFHIFDAGFRHSVRKILMVPIHPLLPAATLVSSLAVGILLQYIGDHNRSISTKKEVKKHSKPADMIKSSKLHIEKTQVDIPKDFSFTKFKEFLTKPASPKKKQLFEETVLKKKKLFTEKYPGHSFEYKKVTLDIKNFIRLTKENSIRSKSKVDTTPDWYDYSEKGAFYTDFANAETFGGSYRRSGNVMEEVMFEEIPALPLIDYLVRQEGSRIYPTRDGGAYPNDEAAPFIIQNVRRHAITSPELYGGGYKKKDIPKYVTIPDKPSPRFHVIGIAAQCWRKGSYKYDQDSLLYHLQAAYLAFVGASEIHAESNGNKPQASVHTGAWGCGVFSNSEKMMVAIQILAARMSGVDLVFHGIGFRGNPGYDENLVHSQESYIDGMLNNKYTPFQILNELRKKQQTDKSYRPK